MTILARNSRDLVSDPPPLCQPKFGILTERGAIRDWGGIMSPPAPNTTYSSFNSTSAVVRTRHALGLAPLVTRVECSL